ncbi:hypothetical protein AB0G73_30585 [Streptomyces sp. NPDC020719]|uniref:hypothetical protein n=1 Tax=Streptomyces sp. NPDC020719 TaxID=3154896 RepID=UPI0033EF7AEB
MTLVAVCSLKGSPGVTTVAVGLAGRWPGGHRPVVVECDPAGGDLMARYWLEMAPGLVSLAAAARRNADPGLLWRHTQQLPGGLPVVVGPPGAEQARAAVRQFVGDDGALLRSVASRAGAVVVADCGRIDAYSPAMPVLHRADMLLLLSHARDDALAHLATRVEAVERWSRRPLFVLVGGGYRSDEVAQELGIEVAARLPEDDRGAAVLSGTAGSRSAPVRSALGKALASLAVRLAGRPAGVRGHAADTDELAAPALHFSLPASRPPGSPDVSGNGAIR